MSRSGKVTVVGAGFYGSTTALRLAESSKENLRV
jgi:malate dehydrogenase